MGHPSGSGWLRRTGNGKGNNNCNYNYNYNYNYKTKYRGLSTAAAKCAASGRDDVRLWWLEGRTGNGNSKSNGENKSEMDTV